jgi:uncharacterized protein YqjF (DUF2071 family)
MLMKLLPNEPRGDDSTASWMPLFLADWDDVVFVHYAIDPAILQPLVPFKLHLHDGRAYMSLVAFTQRRLRPRVGGRVSAFFSAPLASHPFLNVRTYVTHAGEPGIYFLSEWIPNRLAALIGPPLYGLPYRVGRLQYRYDRTTGMARHEIVAGAKLEFDVDACVDCGLGRVAAGSLDEFLLERYIAFTRRRGKSLSFRVNHDPWEQKAVKVRICRHDLLSAAGLDVETMRLVGANYSPGVTDVGLGAPLTCRAQSVEQPRIV